MRVKHIKFKVNKPGKTEKCHGGFLRHPDTLQELNWSLGMGPCGRWVERLEVDITLAVVTIKQTSYAEDHKALTSEAINQLLELKGHWSSSDTVFTDSLGANNKTKEIKTFTYKLEDVRGRIEAIEQGHY